MTRKKSRPQHRETGNTEFEGYKMFWTSIENDDEISNLQNPSSSVIIIDDSSGSSDEIENLTEGVPTVPLSIKTEKSLVANSNDLSTTMTTETINSVRSIVSQEGVLNTPRLPSNNSPSTVRINRNDLEENCVGESHFEFPSFQPETAEGPSEAVSDRDSNLNSIRNGDSLLTKEKMPTCVPISSLSDNLRPVNENAQVNDSNFDILSTEETTNTVVPSSAISSDTDSGQLISCPSKTGQAFSFLKALLNSTSSKPSDIEQTSILSNSNQTVPNPISPSISQNSEVLTTSVTNLSPEPNLTVVPTEEPMNESVPEVNNPSKDDLTVFTTPKEEFPPYTNFLCPKIKLEPCQVPSTLRSMKTELEKLYNSLIGYNAFHQKLEPKLTSSKVIMNYESTYKLNRCHVNLLRFPENLLDEGGISLKDSSFRKWKKKENEIRNEEKFKGLKVWRRGRTLLWRECELLGMDQDTYDQQFKYIQANALSSSSSDMSDDEIPEAWSLKGKSSDIRSKTVDCSRRKSYSKTKSNGLSTSGISGGNEYIVESNTVSDLDDRSAKGKKPSALKITIRKASLGKSEDEITDSDNQGSITHPNKKTKRTFVTKRTYRRPDVPSTKEANQDESDVLENRIVHTDNECIPVENTSVLGCRSYEVENFNLLEKWEIPFEAPTLFRSPRVASRLAQLKNKEAFKAAYVRQPNKAKTTPISKEVKDVVEMLCTKTIEAVLSPDFINESRSESLNSAFISSDSPKSHESQDIEKPEANNEVLEAEGEVKETKVVEKKKTKKKRMTGRIFKSRKKKRIQKPKSQVSLDSTIAHELPPFAGPIADDLQSQMSPLHSTQVPVVSEGPGQGLCAVEDDSNLHHDISAPLDDSVIKIETPPKTREKKASSNRLPESSKDKEVTPEPQDTIIPRVTRAKQPFVEVDLELIEAFCGRRKKKSFPTPANVSPEKSEQNKKQATKTMVKKGKLEGDLSVNESSATKDSSLLNTQVHEVSEGPGEVDRVSHRPDDSACIQPELDNANVNIASASIATKDPVTKQIILDSPLSPTPDDEPLPFVRVTRSKKRISSDGSPYIVMAKPEEAATKDLNEDLNKNENDSAISKIMLDDSIDTNNLSPLLQSPTYSDPGFNSPETGNLVIDCDLPPESSETPNPPTDHASPLPISAKDQFDKSPKKPIPDGIIQNRLAVLDTLNSILATSSKVPKNKQATAISKQKQQVESVDQKSTSENKENNKKAVLGNVVLSEDEGNGTDLANHINQIIHDQIKDDDAGNKENCMNSTEPEMSKGKSKNENSETGKGSNDKKMASIDERTGLPTVLIQRLRDPRIRSKLLSQLECEELNGLGDNQLPKSRSIPNDSKSVAESKLPVPQENNAVLPAKSTAISIESNVACSKPPETSELLMSSEKFECSSNAVHDGHASSSDINTTSKSHDSSDEEECLKRRKKPRKELDTELMYKSPLEDLQSEARPSYGRTPPNRFTRKNIRPREADLYNTRPNRRDARALGHPVVPSGTQAVPRQTEAQWSMYQSDQPLASDISNMNTSQCPSLWTNHWTVNQSFMEAPPVGGGFGSHQHEPRRNFMEIKLMNLALLPKTTNLESPPIKKIFSFFNLGNPQILPIPPVSYDPNEEERTVTMLDAMGQEMIDILQLPRPTSGLTADYFDELPENVELDSLILDPFMPLSHIVDEETDLGPCGINIFEDEDEREFLKKSSTVDTSVIIAQDLSDNSVDTGDIETPLIEPVTGSNTTIDDLHILQRPKPVEDFEQNLTDNPLANILHRLPLLKKQYSMNTSNGPEFKMMSADESHCSTVELKEPPPPPKWSQSEKQSEFQQLASDFKHFSNKIRRRKSPKRRTSRSKSPRRRKSRSKSPRRRKSRSKSPRRRKSRSKSPRRRKSRSKSPRRRRRSRSKSPRRRRSRSKSPSHRRNRSSRSLSRSLSPFRKIQTPLSYGSSERQDSHPGSRSGEPSWPRTLADIPTNAPYHWLPPSIPYLTPRP